MSRFLPGTDLSIYEPESLTGGRPRLKEENKSYAKDDYFDLDKFDSLLGKLEDSKKRQQRQKSVEGRRDIFAGGLANMMSNF